MSYLYLTADQVGLQSGGGRVTQEESTALHDLGVERGEECTIWGRDELSSHRPAASSEPWCWDDAAFSLVVRDGYYQGRWPGFCHVYAGTFTRTVDLLKRNGCKVAYTAAAHNVDKSRDEHLKLGIPFDYPHLVDPQLWDRYVGGYRAADVVVCPSQHSADCMRSYGCQRVEVIPHGVDMVERIKLPPVRFIVGYLGAVGPDKGLVYLLQAWKKLACRDAELMIAGRDSTSAFMYQLIKAVDLNLTAVSLNGWVENTADFYNSISLYIQPSVTEGFGIEVLEAMSHGLAVLVSDGAGAADVVPETWRFQAGNVDDLAAKIGQFRKCDLGLLGAVGRGLAAEYSWDRIRSRYQDLWRSLIS